MTELGDRCRTLIRNYTFLTKKNFVIDSDFILDDLRNEIELNTLFKENRVITLNIVSTSIPQKIKDIISDAKVPDDLKIIIKIDRSKDSNLNNVAIIAINIPIADSKFPCRAVFIFPSFFIAKIKNIDEKRYAMSIMLLFIFISF